MRHGFVTGLLLVVAGGAYAQAPLTFDAASVKRNMTNGAGQPRIVAVSGGRLTAPFATAKELVQAAYGMEPNQVVGGPDWMERDRFEVSAILPPGTSAADAPMLLQRLLAERFSLAAHQEKRELPAYVLTAVGKLGPDLAPAGPECKALKAPAGLPAPPPPPPPLAGQGPMTMLNQPPGSKCGNVMFSGFFSMRAVPMVTFVTNLSRQIRMPIIDRTALTGPYDIDLNFLPDTGPMMFNGTAINADAPSLQTAVREQLGLRLDSARAPIDVVVIDRVMAPSEN